METQNVVAYASWGAKGLSTYGNLTVLSIKVFPTDSKLVILKIVCGKFHSFYCDPVNQAQPCFWPLTCNFYTEVDRVTDKTVHDKLLLLLSFVPTSNEKHGPKEWSLMGHRGSGVFPGHVHTGHCGFSGCWCQLNTRSDFIRSHYNDWLFRWRGMWGEIVILFSLFMD